MDIKDVENLAELAKIELSEAEKGAILKDLGSILNYVKQIEEVEVEDISPTYDHRNIWREDLPVAGEPDFSVGLIKEQFPDSQDGFVKVKKIL
jgi:aspartyl-tRNA(Asn)/glutamyl-tRNA(Gln) amidotransferase subunit C